MKENKRCPVCGKLMIKTRTDTVYPTDPPKYPMQWWCGCGHKEDAGNEYTQSSEQMNQEAWELLNDEARRHRVEYT